MPAIVPYLVFAMVFLLFMSSVNGKKDTELYCAACKIVTEEVEYAISKIDSKKTIEVQGFRVDPKGNQMTKSIPYSTSETYLTEVMEKLCSEMNRYAQSRDKVTGKLEFIRTDSRNGKGVTLENVSMSGEISEKLRYVCENIIEDHEEDLINYFKKTHKAKRTESNENEFCNKVTDFCSTNYQQKNEF